MTRVEEMLRRARNLYDASPSHCGPWETPPEGTYCPITAMEAAEKAMHGQNRWPDVGHGLMLLRYAMSVISPQGGPDSYLSITLWNARHSTEAVVAAFNKAIKMEQR